MMDCPKDLEDSFDSILKLIRDKGTIAFKPHSGSLGRGFYRCSYDEGKYYLNFKEASEEEIIEILSDEKSQYLITEYIVQHKKLSKIYSASVNTVRMIVFKKDGINPEIGNAYIRIGSKKTGTVDNVSAGGLVATIDIETGRIYNGRSIDNNKIEPIRCHPDTGTKLEGILPNWDIIKTNVLNIARELKQIEYFGFDVAITENGFKLPEINRSPDYPKIENYTSLTNDYMLYKVKNRRMRYGLPEE